MPPGARGSGELSGAWSRTPGPARWAPVPAIHLSTCTNGVPLGSRAYQLAQCPGGGGVVGVVAAGLPWCACGGSAAWRRGGPRMGRLSLCPTPESPSLPTCSLGSSGCSAREEGQQARPGTRAGSQAPLTQAETPAQTSGPCLPHRAGVETHIGIWVANDRDNLHNKNSSSCCPESLGTHSSVPAVTVLRQPGAHAAVIRVAGRRKGWRGYSQAR